MKSNERDTHFNILLADDDVDDCAFFKEALEGFPMATHLTCVHDGEELTELLADETNELPRVLFLDLNMPRKNGFECLSEIKLNDKLRSLPVIIFSTSFDQKIVNMLYENGAHHFARKPSGFPQFRRIIQQTLNMIISENGAKPTEKQFVVTLQA